MLVTAGGVACTLCHAPSLLSSGILNRQQAVALLDRKPVGSYLVRLGARIWGYTISVKSEFHAHMASYMYMAFA